MQQLQLHEYLALLDGGMEQAVPTPALERACLRIAEALWPQLALGAWSKRKRTIAYVAKCLSSGKRLVHITANAQNCFLILVVAPRKLRAESYLLFDIGAEYTEAKLICPAFELDQPADKATIRTTIPKLRGQGHPFAILAIGEGTYLQTYAEDGRYDVEHQLVSTAAHYCLAERVPAKVVVKLFLSYAFGKKEWAREFAWQKMQL